MANMTIHVDVTGLDPLGIDPEEVAEELVEAFMVDQRANGTGVVCTFDGAEWDA